MDVSTNAHVESARIQKQIEEHLGLDSSQLLFDFRPMEDRMRLDLITVNPRHHQSFLLHTETGYDRVDALRKMLDYVRQSRDQESSFTIQWIARGERELHTSYFRASNMYDALDKLYYGRDMTTITVFSVVLNPVS
jgi:carbamoylphosphate synthase large subunit